LKSLESRKELVTLITNNSYLLIVLPTIKDVNQSLVDDNLVEFDKIGAGAFFWALPSKGFSQR